MLRDPNRNFLFNHLGLGEDEKELVINPDCADLPYFLRGYFAFKMGLPFGYSKCTRGGGGKPPQCPAWWNIQKEEPPPAPLPASDLLQRGLADSSACSSRRQRRRPPAAQACRSRRGSCRDLASICAQTVANGVHSGAGRTAADDDNNDYYPVSLKQETLRPGTIYADPYGHVLVLAKRVAQTPTPARRLPCRRRAT